MSRFPLGTDDDALVLTSSRLIARIDRADRYSHAAEQTPLSNRSLLLNGYRPLALVW